MTKTRTFLSDAQVRRKLGDCGRSTIWRYRHLEHGFPKPLKMGGRNLTADDELDAYLDSLRERPAEDDAPGGRG
jgi:predicted DNA-binding transcriptional regulator AlpA